MVNEAETFLAKISVQTGRQILIVALYPYSGDSRRKLEEVITVLEVIAYQLVLLPPQSKLPNNAYVLSGAMTYQLSFYNKLITATDEIDVNALLLLGDFNAVKKMCCLGNLHYQKGLQINSVIDT